MMTNQEQLKQTFDHNCALFDMKPVAKDDLEKFANDYGWCFVPTEAAKVEFGNRVIIAAWFSEEELSNIQIIATDDAGMALFNDKQVCMATCTVEIDGTL